MSRSRSARSGPQAVAGRLAAVLGSLVGACAFLAVLAVLGFLALLVGGPALIELLLSWR